MRAPSPCTKHSQGEKRCDGGHDDGPLTENVMFPRAANEAAAEEAEAAFREVISTAGGADFVKTGTATLGTAAGKAGF